MDKKENIETAQEKERKPGRNWKESKLIFLVLPIILTILFPSGVLWYLCGRFIPYAITLAHVCLLYPVIGVFIIYCFFAGIIRLFSGWKKYIWKKRLLIVAQIGIPMVFIVLLIAPFFLPESEFFGYGYKFFMYGLRGRVKSKVDVEATRDWLKMLSKEEHDYTEFNAVRIPSNKWSKSLKALKPGRVNLLADENGNPKFRLMWGSGAMGHWGVDIGMRNMKTPPSDFSQWGEYRLPVEPGMYVWWQLQ